MNSELLLKHFDRISDAPDAVPRLRQFILDLAVRGKLVEQDPLDEPASILLKRTEAEKMRLIEKGTIRNPRVSNAGHKEGELFSIPAPWVWCRLSEIGAIVGGGTPPSGDAANFTEAGTGIAWLTPSDLGKRTELHVSHGARDLTSQGLQSSSATLMPKGSILFTSRAPIGYIAIAANEVSTNQGFKSVVPYILECNRYIAIYFSAFARWIDGKASGTTFREVSGKIVGNLPFPLPPLGEQHRIVTKVDELITFCDQLEAAQAERETRRDTLVAASLHHLNNGAHAEAFGEHSRFFINHLPLVTARLEHIKQLRQTILNLAVRGMLVSQDPSDEPASELVKRIQHELNLDRKRETGAGLPDRLTSAEQLPTSWRLVRIGVIAKSIVPQRDKPLTFTGGLPWVTLPNFRDEKLVLQFDEGRVGLSLAEVERYRLRVVPAGSVLMSCVGRFGLTALTSEDCIPNQQIHAFCFPKALLDGKYLCYTIMARRGYLESQATATTISYLNKSRCESIPVALPPLGEQRRIVAKVDDLMALCDRLEEQVTISQTVSRRLLEAILNQALNDNQALEDKLKASIG